MTGVGCLEPGPAAQVCWPRCPAKLQLKIQTGEVAEARGRDDLGDDWGKCRKLAEATEVMQALEREERGGEEWRGEKPYPGT